jgi:uncharacterized coiled-coil DUF342 family protein
VTGLPLDAAAAAMRRIEAVRLAEERDAAGRRVRELRDELIAQEARYRDLCQRAYQARNTR